MTHATLTPTVVSPAEGRVLDVLGHAVTIQLARAQSQGHYYVFSLTTPPGHGIPEHVHDREDELITVVDGAFRVTLGGREYTAQRGDQIFFPRHIPHSFQNIGSVAGKTVWTVVPGGNFEDCFEQLGALPPGPPNLSRVSQIFAAFGMKITA
jgi:quercetin dioxygenase-like cupin family protein